MDLWVRSQDKTFLKKVNTIGIVEGQDFYFISENITTDLGKYKSKERVLEVLDEIHQRLIDLQTIECTGDYRFTKRNLDCVYEMPKE